MRWLRGVLAGASSSGEWRLGGRRHVMQGAKVADLGGAAGCNWRACSFRRLTASQQRQFTASSEQAAAPSSSSSPPAEQAPKPYQAPANPADRASSTSRRKDIDRSRYGRTRANVAEAELGEDISAGRSRTYVREDDIESQTATTLPEILRMDLHRRQNLPLLRDEVRVKRTGSGLAHTPEIADTWLTTDGEKPKAEKTERQRQRDKHIVPQHRKYLTHGKIRTGGSSYKRQKLDDQRRATVARQRIAERERAAAGIEEEERPTDQAGYQELVERKIQAGIAQGQFDTKQLKYAGVDLLAASRGQGDVEVQRVFGRGQGAVGAYVSKEDFMLNRMMKEQGAAPTWIFERKDINAAVVDLVEDLTDTWESAKRRTGLPVDDERSTQKALLAPAWRERVQAAVAEVESINKRIRDYNLTCPAPCSRMIVRLERELGRVVYDDPAAGSKLKLL